MCVRWLGLPSIIIGDMYVKGMSDVLVISIKPECKGLVVGSAFNKKMPQSVIGSSLR